MAVNRTPARRKAVIFFDIGQVLLAFDGLKAARRIAQNLGLNSWKTVRFFCDSALVDSIERGEIPPRRLHRLFRREVGFEGDFDAFKRLWCGQFRLNKDTAALFARLSRSHRVYLLSNTNHLHYEHIRKRYVFARQARAAVLSHRLKLRKPEPQIFAAALKIAGAKPRQCVFIDDRADNVRAAAKAGLRAIRYAGAARLKEDLAALGLL